MKINSGYQPTMTETHKALERLKQKRNQLNAQIQHAEARERTEQRRQDIRRKILIGSYYLEQAQQAGKYQQIIEHMNDFLTRPSDRKLFGLEDPGSSQTPSSANQDVRS